jgi:hypothetical protein
MCAGKFDSEAASPTLCEHPWFDDCACRLALRKPVQGIGCTGGAAGAPASSGQTDLGGVVILSSVP